MISFCDASDADFKWDRRGWRAGGRCGGPGPTGRRSARPGRPWPPRPRPSFALTTAAWYRPLVPGNPGRQSLESTQCSGRTVCQRRRRSHLIEQVLGYLRIAVASATARGGHWPQRRRPVPVALVVDAAALQLVKRIHF